MSESEPRLEPLGNGRLLRAAGLAIYLDPEELGDAASLPRADIICFTTEDPKKLPFRSVKRLAGPQTVILGVPPCVAPFHMNQMPMLPGQTRQVLGVRIGLEKEDGGPLRVRLELPGLVLRHP